MPIVSFPYTDEQLEKFSDLGLEIHAICQLLVREESTFTQAKIARFNDYLIQNNLDESGSIVKFSKEELSNAKRRYTSITRDKTTKVLKSLYQLSLYRGLEIVDIKRVDKRLELNFERKKDKKIEFLDPTSVNVKSLKENGVVKIEDREPSKEVGYNIKEAYELRILQSCLYGWENDWEEKIKDGIINGKLRKIKFLLAQTYSNTASNRAHTINEGAPDPIYSFNQRVVAIVSQIINFFNTIKGELDANMLQEVSFEVKLYFHSTPIPIYQLLDREGGSIVCYYGIFWQHKSSRLGPHIKINGSRGRLIDFVNNHFEKIWSNDYESNQQLDWYTINGLSKNIRIYPVDSKLKVFNLLENAFSMRHFSNYHNEKPYWLNFRCYYHNKADERREFLLEIDLEHQKARITDTQRKSTYYGLAFKLGRSCSIIVHTRNESSPARLIYINFYLRTENLESQEKAMFGVYNNCDYATGFPYAQLIVIQPVINKDLETPSNDILAREFEENAPSIKEKKIDIEYEEFSLTDENRNKGSYIFTFNGKTSDFFYERLKKEISFARHEICFLGHGPNHFPVGNKNLMRSYFDSHKQLIKQHGVEIHRILLKDTVSEEFIEIMKDIKDDKEISDKYYLYLATQNLPIIADMVLIDPEDDNKTAILTYTMTKNLTKVTFPIKMEVIKDKNRLINSFNRTFSEYLNMRNSGFIKELNSAKDIEQMLRVTSVT